MKFEPLVSFLEENVSGLKGGKTLFVNQMPVTALTGVLLKDAFTGTEIDGEIPSLRRGRFVAVARAHSYAKALSMINDVSAALTMTGVVLDGMEVKSIRPLSEPVGYMLSVGNNFEFSVSFSAIYGIVAE